VPPPAAPFPPPGSSRRFDRGGGIGLHWVERGAGDPIVLVHGNPSWSFLWRGLLEGLADRGRCIASDHVGMGLSDRPGEDRYDYTLRSRVDDLEALLEHAGARERVTLVLHDWGGMIGMAWAARHPERVARIVACNTAAFRLPTGKPLPRELWWVRNTPLGPLLVRGFNLFVRGAIRRCTVRPLPPETAAAYAAPYRSWSDRRAVLRFVEDIPLAPGERSWPMLEATEAALPAFRDRPMLLAWGMRDFIFDGDFLEEWIRRFPGAEVLRFEEAGHWLTEDVDLVPVVRDFLDRHPIP
jgi:haloalkane dehalogenase